VPRLGEALNHIGKMIEALGELTTWRRHGIAEARQIRRRELLDAAMPSVQTPPAYGSDTASA